VRSYVKLSHFIVWTRLKLLHESLANTPEEWNRLKLSGLGGLTGSKEVSRAGIGTGPGEIGVSRSSHACMTVISELLSSTRFRNLSLRIGQKNILKLPCSCDLSSRLKAEVRN